MKYGIPFNPYGMFHGLFIPNCIAQSDISDRAKILMGRLIQYAGPNGECFPSRKRLCKELRWKLRKLDHVIRELKEAELIETEQEDENSSSNYLFLYSSIYESDAVKNSSRASDKNDSTPTVKNSEHKINKENKELKDSSKEELGVKTPRKKTRQVCKETDKIDKARKALEKRKGRIAEKDIAVYQELLASNFIIKHRKDSKAEIETLETIHRLLSPKLLNPFSKLHPEYKKTAFTSKQMIACLEINNERYKKKINFATFVMNKFATAGPVSSMIFALKSKKKDTAPKSELAKKIYTFFKKKGIRDIDHTPVSVFNTAASRLEDIMQRYELHYGCNSVMYPFGVRSVFQEFVQEKLNQSTFKLGYICGENFMEEFVREAKHRHAIIPKKRQSQTL
jgi:hypothetical protein